MATTAAMVTRAMGGGSDGGIGGGRSRWHIRESGGGDPPLPSPISSFQVRALDNGGSHQPQHALDNGICGGDGGQIRWQDDWRPLTVEVVERALTVASPLPSHPIPILDLTVGRRPTGGGSSSTAASAASKVIVDDIE